MHVANYTRAAFGKLLDHYDRQEGDGVERSNPNIDPSRTRENYTIGGTGRADVRRAVRSAIQSHNEVQAARGKRALRSNATVMSDIVVTLPRNCREEDAETFFRFAHAFLVDRYGEERVGCAFVHMDESQPHMHVPIVPVMGDGTLNKSKVITRNDLKTLHGDMQAYMDTVAPYHVSILLDEDERVQKALSNVPQKDLEAVKAYFKEQVHTFLSEERSEIDAKAAENAVEARRLGKWATDLETRETALRDAQTALDRRERSVIAGEKQVEGDRMELNAQVAGVNAALEQLQENLDAAIERNVRRNYAFIKEQEKQQVEHTISEIVNGASEAARPVFDTLKITL